MCVMSRAIFVNEDEKEVNMLARTYYPTLILLKPFNTLESDEQRWSCRNREQQWYEVE
jgi:hypothetical protein